MKGEGEVEGLSEDRAVQPGGGYVLSTSKSRDCGLSSRASGVPSRPHSPKGKVLPLGRWPCCPGPPQPHYQSIELSCMQLEVRS